MKWAVLGFLGRSSTPGEIFWDRARHDRGAQRAATRRGITSDAPRIAADARTPDRRGSPRASIDDDDDDERRPRSRRASAASVRVANVDARGSAANRPHGSTASTGPNSPRFTNRSD